MNRPVRVSVLTVSDSGARGERDADLSGDAIVEWVRGEGFEVVGRDLVFDETDSIAHRLCTWADDGVTDIILTTGGTGLAPRDVTPEATLAVIDRNVPGIAESIRAFGAAKLPNAILSRGIAGLRGETLIVNLPGSPGGVKDGLQVLTPILRHAVEIICGEPSGH